MGKRITTGQFITKAKEVHGNKYSYELVEYIGALSKVRIVCPEHGVFEQAPNDHIKGHGCGGCKGNKQLTTKLFISKSKEIHSDKYSYELTKYVNRNTKVRITCPIHGVFEQKAGYHLTGRGCIKCGYLTNNDNTRLTTGQFITKAKEVHGNRYSYESVEYINSKNKVRITCPIHGVFEQTPDSHYQEHGCPKCTSSISQQEIELQDWLSQHIDITTNDRTLITPLELDIVIPSKKIAIEYNGLYWHSEQRGKGPKYHLNKYNLCKESGYRLIQVWENEWLQKKDIVKSIILSAIGQYERKIHGRKCVIKEIPSKEARVMYDNNHIQGFKGGTHHGLYHEGELVSLMTIDKTGELQRFVNKTNTLVHGAFTKLLKSFDVKEIHTFADLRYFTGNVYEKNGFVINRNIRPSYWYFKDKLEVIHRRRFQRNNIMRSNLSFDPNLTEYENMLANGYDRIWDCGKVKYIHWRMVNGFFNNRNITSS